MKVHSQTKTILRMIAPLIDVGLDVSGFEQLHYPLRGDAASMGVVCEYFLSKGRLVLPVLPESWFAARLTLDQHEARNGFLTETARSNRIDAAEV